MFSSGSYMATMSSFNDHILLPVLPFQALFQDIGVTLYVDILRVILEYIRFPDYIYNDQCMWSDPYYDLWLRELQEHHLVDRTLCWFHSYQHYFEPEEWGHLEHFSRCLKERIKKTLAKRTFSSETHDIIYETVYLTYPQWITKECFYSWFSDQKPLHQELLRVLTLSFPAIIYGATNLDDIRSVDKQRVMQENLVMAQQQVSTLMVSYLEQTLAQRYFENNTAFHSVLCRILLRHKAWYWLRRCATYPSEEEWFLPELLKDLSLRERAK